MTILNKLPVLFDERQNRLRSSVALLGSVFTSVLTACSDPSTTLTSLSPSSEDPVISMVTSESMEAEELGVAAPLRCFFVKRQFNIECNRLYVNDSSRNLYVLDVETLQATRIGTTPVTFFDIAANSSGELFGISSSLILYRINQSTAEATSIGTVPGSGLNALVFDRNDTLWAAGSNTLVRVNPLTGSGTSVTSLAGRTSSGDLAILANGNLLLSTTSRELLEINPNTTSVSVYGSLPSDDIFSSAKVLAGTVTLIDANTNQVYSLNELTGRIDFLGTIQANFSLGQAFGASRISL